MKVQELIDKFKLLPQDMDIYRYDPEETGGCIEFISEPKITSFVVCKSNITSYDLHEETYIDLIDNCYEDDPLILKKFEAVLI